MKIKLPLIRFSLAPFLFIGLSSTGEAKSLTLNECISLALKNNPQIIQAKANIASAQANVLGSWANLSPQISLRSEVTRSGPATKIWLSPLGQPYSEEGGYEDSYRTNFYISHPLLDFRSWSEVSQVQGKKRVTEIEYEITRENLILQVKREYYGLLKAARLLEVAESALRQSEEQLKRVESMFELGIVAKSDLLKSKVSRAENKLNLITAQNNLKIAQDVLAKTLGIEPSPDLEVFDDLSIGDDSLDLEDCLRQAKMNRPEISQVYAQIAQEKAGIWQAKSGWIPVLTASGGYGSYDKKFPRSKSDWLDHDTWSMGISLGFNLFDGFATLANFRAAKASLRYFEAELTKIEREISSEVKQAYFNFLAARQKLEVAKESEESAEEDYRLSNERYRLGSATMLDLLESQLALTRARVRKVETLYDSKVAKAELEKAMGKRG